MHRLQDGVIFIVRPELFDEGLARRFRPQAISDQLGHFRSPLAEIVVHIDRGNTRFPRSLFEPGESGGDCQGTVKDCLSVGKLEMIDHVNENEREAGFMTDMARCFFHDLGSRWGGGMAGGFFFFSRAKTSFIVNWLADSRSFSSFHESGRATGAPARARTA